MPRRLSSWLEAYERYVETLPSPPLFKKWTGLSALSSALERKVWCTAIRNRPLYPNTYIVLCGPPAAGKSVVTSEVQMLLKDLKTHHLASSSITKAAMMDELKNATRTLIIPGKPYIEFNFLSIVSNELGVLIPAYDNDFMSALTDIYDGSGYSEKRRSNKIDIAMPNAQFNLLAATTPSYLAGTLPVGAWDQGFLSRTMLIFSGAAHRQDLFAIDNTDTKAYEDLVHDLKIIGELYGKIAFTKGAAALMNEWHLAGGPPVPEHPKLVSYVARRTVHMLKLCMLYSVSESDNLLVEEEHFIKALDTLVEAEAVMPDIFKAMTQNGDQRAIEELWYQCLQWYGPKKQPIPETRIIAFLSEKVPAYSVFKIIEVMEKGGALQEVWENRVKCYVPKGRGAPG